METQAPLMFQIAGGVMLALFFFAMFTWGLRMLHTPDKWKWGVFVTVMSFSYGAAIVISSVP